MTVRSPGIYLNALCLAAYAPGASSLQIAKAVVDMYDSMSRDEQSLLNPISRLYVKLLKEVRDGKVNLSNRAEASALLLQYQDDPAFNSNKFSFEELKNTLIPIDPPSATKIKSLFNKVKLNIIFFKSSQRIRKMNITSQNAARNEDDEEKQISLLKDLLADAESLRIEIESNPSGEEDNTAPVDEIDMNDPASIMRALKQQHKKRNAAIIRFGLQGLNRMFGPPGGAAYGECMALAARSHNGKSEMLMSMARWHCTLNDPPDCGGKEPIVLFISLENEVSENLMGWYKNMYANTYHKFPIGLSDEEIVEYVSRAFKTKGFHFLVFRRMGEAFGYHEYIELVDKVEKKYNGKVVACYLDYVTLCKRCPEDKNFNDAKQIQLMVQRFKDHAAHNEMFFCTGLQLDTEASRIAQSGQTNIVKRYNEATLADCRGIMRELDLLFFLEIETNHKGIPYMTMAWRKHRYVHDTPPEHKWCAYRFTELGLLNDVDTADTSVKDIYADEDDSGEGAVIEVF